MCSLVGSEPMPEKYTWTFTSPTQHVGRMRRGEPYASIVSAEHASEIGSILILWSEYTRYLSDFYTAIYEAVRIDPEKWKPLDFQQRITFLKGVLSEYFADDQSLVRLLTDIVDRSVGIAAIRHALAHGRYEWTARLKDQSMVPVVRVIRRYKKTSQTFELSVSDLLDVRHELANLTGKLNSILGCERPDNWLQNALPSAEISHLQQILVKRT